MALRAGYYGLKTRDRSKLLDLIDSIPEGLSPENPIASKNDVLTSVDLLKDTTGWTGKNDYNIFRMNYTNAGLTDVTVNQSTGTLYLNGTTSGEFIFPQLATPSEKHVDKLKNIKPNTKYTFSIGDTGYADIRLNVYVKETSSSSWINLVDEGNVKSVEFTTPSQIYDLWVRINIYANKTISAVTLYPMLTETAKYSLSPTYEPYHESVELSKYNRSEANILGAKNLFPIDLNTLKAKNTTGTWSDNVYSLNNATITCTVENGYVTEITANSENPISQNTNFILFDGSNSTNLVNSLKGKELTLNGCPKNGSNTSYRMLFSTWGTLENKYDNGDGCTVDVPNNVTGMRFDVVLYSGYTPNNLKFRPMIRLATDTDPAYVPYAMTNRELTEMIENNGTYDVCLIVSAVTPSNGAQPEFFIPWFNPEFKTPTFSLTIRLRGESAWQTLEQSGAINVQKVCKNGFLVNPELTTALTANTSYTFRIDGTITFGTANREISEPEPVTKKATKKKVIKEEE